MEVLKTEYNTRLINAIKNPTQENIQYVLDVNSALADNVRSSGVKKIPNVKELLKYQKHFDDIIKSKNKQETLMRIHSDTDQQLASATVEYTIYIALLIIATFMIIIYIFRSAAASAIINISNALSVSNIQG
jgi:hypothetical protein